MYIEKVGKKKMGKSFWRFIYSMGYLCVVVFLIKKSILNLNGFACKCEYPQKAAMIHKVLPMYSNYS